jgi:hypothetical protein
MGYRSGEYRLNAKFRHHPDEADQFYRPGRHDSYAFDINFAKRRVERRRAK